MRELLALLAASTLCASTASAQENLSSPPAEPVTFFGSCDSNPPLANIVRVREKAKKVEVPSCTRAVVDLGRSVVLYKGDTEVVRFIGSRGNGSDITMEQVQVQGAPAAAATNGRCRFYGNENAGTVMIVCFAAFQNDKNETIGAVAMFEGKGR